MWDDRVCVAEAAVPQLLSNLEDPDLQAEARVCSRVLKIFSGGFPCAGSKIFKFEFFLEVFIFYVQHQALRNT